MSNSGVPPNDVVAEAAVLSACALDAGGETLDTIRGILGPESFYDPKNRLLFEVMCGLADAAQPTDIITLWNRIRAVDLAARLPFQYVNDIIDATPAVANVFTHARIVQDCHRMRSALSESRRVAAELDRLDGTDPDLVRQLLTDTEQRFSDLAHDRTTAKLRPVSDVLRDVQDKLSLAFDKHSAVTGIPTGFKAIDRMTTGLQDGDTTIVAARPGMGKSAFALGVALNVARAGYGCAFFSLEMPAEQLALRLLAVETRMDLTILRTGRFDPALWPRITDAMGELSALPLYIDDTAGITILEVRARVKRLKRELEAGRHLGCHQRRLALVVIDYLQLMRSERDYRSREQEVSSISRSCKMHAKQLEVHYMPLSQLNRDPEKRSDKEPQLADLRESGAIEQDADNVLLLHRPSYYKPDDPDLQGWAKIIVAKQRNGPTGSSKLAFRNACTRFDDFTEEYDDDEFEGLPTDDAIGLGDEY